MNKFTKFIKRFIETRNVAYYVALGVALLSAVIGIVSGASLAFAGETALTVVLPLLGLVAFVALSALGQEKTGAAASGLLTFGALIALVCGVYGHFLTAIQNQSMGGFDLGAIDGFFTLIVCAVLLVVCAVAANVLAWLRLKKKPAPPAAE